jgi:tetratricopeptide (TPR) repeat protein
MLEPDGIDQRALHKVGDIVEQYDTYHKYVRLQQLMKPIRSHQEALLRCEEKRQIQHTAQKKISRILNGALPSTRDIIKISSAYLNNDEAKRAISLLTEAIILNPSSAELYNNLCVAYGIEKKYVDAVSACSNALRIAPHFQLAKNNLAWVSAAI